jgi:hypothetical protein
MTEIHPRNGSGIPLFWGLGKSHYLRDFHAKMRDFHAFDLFDF